MLNARGSLSEKFRGHGRSQEFATGGTKRGFGDGSPQGPRVDPWWGLRAKPHKPETKC